MTETSRPRIFLSASVPLPSRNPTYLQTADVIAIRDAIRAVTMVIAEYDLQLVFGGHPAITPMIRLQIRLSGRPVDSHFVMFQSRFFERKFPPDNQDYECIQLVDAVPKDREASLARMRDEMLSGEFACGLFVGGMEGVEDEYCLFKNRHDNTPAFPIASTGAAARKIYDKDPNLSRSHPELLNELSYLTLVRDLVDSSLPKSLSQSPI